VLLCACHFKEARFAFDTNYETICTDPLRQQIYDSNRSATDVDGPRAGFDGNLIEQPSRGLLKTLSLRGQPLSL